MGSKRKSKQRNYSLDKRKLRKKLKRKPVILCKQLNDAWDKNKTTLQNLKNMGVAFDPNKTIKIPTNEPKMIAEGLPEKEEPKPEQYEVIQSMEMEAALGEKEKRFQISSEEVHFCTHMMDTYGENYKAMARDSKNYFQLTPKQIRNRIRSFKRSKEQYQKYLNKKKAVEQPDEETNTSHAVANDNMEE